MFNYSGVNSISFLGNSCTRIGEYAFANTKRLEGVDVVLPDSIEIIEEKAFVLTYAQSFSLGGGISYIGKNAFRCFGVTGIDDYGKTEKIYFRSNATLSATDPMDDIEVISFVANSEENALLYAKLLFRADYIYEV